MNRRNFFKATGIAAGSLMWITGIGTKAYICVRTGKDMILRGMFPDTLKKSSYNRHSIIAASLISNGHGGIGYKVVYTDLSSEIRRTFTKDEINQLFKNELNYARRWEIQPDQPTLKDDDVIVWQSRVL
jgi:hypothetical protein